MPMTLVMLWLAAALAAPAAAGVLPELPDAGPLAALVERPKAECNAAESFQAAEDAYRRSGELDKPRAERLPLAPNHPAARLVLEGLECRRCEFPYSADLAIPPLEQPIPSASLYWATAQGLRRNARALRDQGRHGEADREIRRLLWLGLLLREDPGMSFVQQLTALNILAEAAADIGDRAIASGEPAKAADCARFLAQHNAYRRDMRGLLAIVAVQPLLEDPARAAEQIRLAAPLASATTNAAVRLEVLIYLGLAAALPTEPAARQAARGALVQAEQDRDPRIRKLARWGLQLRPDEARRIVSNAANWPVP